MSAFLRVMRVTNCNRNVILGGLRDSIGSTRHFANVARQEDYVEEVVVEEVDIDPRKLPADYDPATFDPTLHRSPPTERVWRLVDEVSSLTLVEAAALSSVIQWKMGMTEAPTIGGMAGAGGGGGGGAAAAAQEEKKEEKTAFQLKLESFEAASKLKVIKEIRALTQLGLKEAKELVEKTPAVFKKGVSKEEAEQVMEKLKAIGAVVVME